MSFLNALEPVILVVHYLISIFMIIVILLQAGKGADIGAAFGAGSSQTLFGARGAATLLSKATTVVALLFLATSLSLATISKSRQGGSSSGKSVVETIMTEDKAPKEEKKPEAPAKTQPAPTTETIK